MKLKNFELKNFEKRKEELKKLKEKAKPLEELIAKEYFEVLNVKVSWRKISISPASEMVVGARARAYDAGFEAETEIDVKPKSDIPVRTLYFHGFSIVKSGNEIYAKIPKFKREYDEFNREEFYLERDFEEKEEAIEIKILYPNGTRTERSVNYNKFLG